MGIVEPVDMGGTNTVVVYGATDHTATVEVVDGVARLEIVVPVGTAGEAQDDEPPDPPPLPKLSAGQFQAPQPTFRRPPGRHPLSRWLQRKHGGGRR